MGALAKCTYINLGVNQVGDAGLSALAGALSSGALPALRILGLGNNNIGDVGLQAFADALGKGALASLKTLYVNDGPLGTEHPALKVACDARGINLP